MVAGRLVRVSTSSDNVGTNMECDAEEEKRLLNSPSDE